MVNEQDEVIDTVSKQEAHEKGLLHRTVIAEIINTRGEFVLVQQSSDRQDAGQFVSPVGGHVEAGESEEEAIKREANEEFGLAEVTCKLIGKEIFYREVKGRKENHYFVLYEIHSDAIPILNEESVGFEYFSREKLAQEIKTKPTKFGDAFIFVIKTFYPELLS